VRLAITLDIPEDMLELLDQCAAALDCTREEVFQLAFEDPERVMPILLPVIGSPRKPVGCRSHR
jgi:hypothetical protein